MSIKAMKQVIELYDKHCYNNDYGGIEFNKNHGYKFIEAIEALRTAIQQAEAKTDVRCEGCGYMTHHREHMGCVRAAKQFTHPAPGVPDDVARDTERLNELEALVQSKGTHGLSFDYCKHVEDGYVVEKGFRVMWRHHLGERKPTLREAIDAASPAQKGQP